jgi:type I restriction enzyme R subunit
LFNDAEWDGEPVDVGGDDAGNVDGTIDNDSDGGESGNSGEVGEGENSQPKLKIRLRDGKVRELQSMTSTYFYVDGKPISPDEFLNRLFDTIKLPALLGSEEELRKVWANPLTRRDLMQKLEKEGCHKDDLVNLQELISAEDSDLFDVLKYIAYAKPTVSRAARVETNKDNIYNLLNTQQREFINYVLRNYLKVGVELAVENLSTVVIAKYGSIHAAQQKPGSVQEIQNTFIDFQQHLYQEATG